MNISIVDMAVPSNWAGKTLEQLNIRSRYGISIIGIRGLEETNANPSASYALHPQDVLIVLGHNTEIQKLREMTNYKIVKRFLKKIMTCKKGNFNTDHLNTSYFRWDR